MIKKVRITTTLSRLKENQPCAHGWATLLKSLLTDYPNDKPINLLHILKSNGVQDMMWAIRATDMTPQLRVAICADMAARVLKIFEKQCPKDKRPRECIKACRLFVRGKLSLDGLQKYAATATYTAAIYATYAATSVSAERKAQAAIIRKYLK